MKPKIAVVKGRQRGGIGRRVEDAVPKDGSAQSGAAKLVKQLVAK